METNEEFIDALADAGRIRGDRLINVFRDVDRAHFVRPDRRRDAYADEPLPIGEGQTISQPSTVAFMLERLDPLPGERVLDVGAGSGWTTALLARLVGSDGEVIGVELEPPLVTFGRTNLETSREFENATIVEAEPGTLGWPGEAPYHRILVSAATDALPQELIDQLRNGGRLVIPIDDGIWVVDKLADGNLEIEKHRGFRFVPLRHG